MKLGMMSKTLYAPILLLYFLAPIYHDVAFYSGDYDISDWLMLGVMYGIGLLFSSPLLYLLFKLEPNSTQSRRVGIRVVSCCLLLLGCILLFWKSSGLFYASLLASITCSYFIMSLRREDLNLKVKVYKDNDSGSFYEVKNGKSRLLNANEVMKVAGLVDAGKMNIYDYGHTFSEGSRITTSSINDYPLSDSGISPESSTTNFTNPSTGLPMSGGMSGLDIAGNTWGTSFNDPVNNGSGYDPNRGY